MTNRNTDSWCGPSPASREKDSQALGFAITRWVDAFACRSPTIRLLVRLRTRNAYDLGMLDSRIRGAPTVLPVSQTSYSEDLGQTTSYERYNVGSTLCLVDIYYQLCKGTKHRSDNIGV